MLCWVLSRQGEAAQAFQPPPPPSDSFDWVQLTSGEWLKGELIALYDGSLEFDSDKLDNLKLDWDDILQVRTARIVQVRFKDQRAATGRLVVEDKTVRVLGDTEQQFDRAAILSIAPGEPREINYCSGAATFGFNLAAATPTRSKRTRLPAPAAAP